MNVPIVYDEIIEACAQAGGTERSEIDAVAGALARMGYEPLPMPVNLSVDKSAFQSLGARFIFNCIDSLDESGRFVHIVPTILDELCIPYTGASADAIYLTSNKLLAKRFLRVHELRTARWSTVDQAAAGDVPFAPPYIVKHVWEDASFGLDERSVFHKKADLVAHAAGVGAGQRDDYFVEAFIDGREFNVSLISGEDGPLALPPLEIEFHGFGEGRPRIVDYETKWGSGSTTEARIERRFEFDGAERPLIDTLSGIARECWELFRLEGYARVDFRVDRDGRPWILEINANPYLGDDSSFLAAAARAGLAFDDVIRLIVDDALGRTEAPAARW